MRREFPGRKTFTDRIYAGAGGYYGRQAGFSAACGWMGCTVDASLPLGRKFELTTESFAGRDCAWRGIGKACYGRFPCGSCNGCYGLNSVAVVTVEYQSDRQVAVQ